MKSLKNQMKLIGVFAALFLLLLSGCRDEELQAVRKGKLQIGISSPEISSGRQATYNQPASVLVSIENEQGHVVANLQMMAIYRLGNSFISENLELETGNYKLTQFIVLNGDDESIFIAPVTGSEAASQVSSPLPIPFTVSSGGTSKVTVEVIPVHEEDTPQSFGYANFSFSIVRPVHDLTFNLKGFVRLPNFTKEAVAFPVIVKGYKYDAEMYPIEVWSSEITVEALGHTLVLKDTLDAFSLEVTGTSEYQDVSMFFMDLFEIENFTVDHEFYLYPKTPQLREVSSLQRLSVADYHKHVTEFKYSRGRFIEGHLFVQPPNEWSYFDVGDYSVSYSYYAIPQVILHNFNTGNASWMTYQSTSGFFQEFPTSFLIKIGNSHSVLQTETLSLTWNGDRISQAFLYQSQSNKFNHQYGYDNNGNVTSVEITDANGLLRYQITMQYDNNKNFIPPTAYQDWIKASLTSAHTDLLIVPYVLGAPVNNLTFLDVIFYQNGIPYSREKVTYHYQYDDSSLKKPVALDVDVEAHLYESGETRNYPQAIKNTIFKYTN